MNGKQDDGIIRIERSITGVKSDKDVTVEFSFYGSSQIFNALAAVVGYIGSIPTTSKYEDLCGNWSLQSVHVDTFGTAIE